MPSLSTKSKRIQGRPRSKSAVKDFLRRTITAEETIVEITKKNSPTGERMVVKPYPKNDKPRTLRVSQDLLDVLADGSRSSV